MLLMCKQVGVILEGLCDMIAGSVSGQHIVTKPSFLVRLLRAYFSVDMYARTLLLHTHVYAHMLMQVF